MRGPVLTQDMAYIQVIGPEEADGRLKEAYDELTQRRGRVSAVLSVQSLLPETMSSHLRLYMDIMFGGGPLRRLHGEAIAVVVSSLNGCTYCVKHHGDALAVYLKDEAARAALVEDFEHAPIDAELKALLRYATKLTVSPQDMDAGDVERLRAAGWDDEAVLQTNLITAYFNFVNRTVHGLGVELEKDRSGFKY